MIAYVVHGPPGPPVWQVILIVAALIAAVPVVVIPLLTFGDWLSENHPAVTFALCALLAVGMIAAVIGGVYVAGHPPACAASGTC